MYYLAFQFTTENQRAWVDKRNFPSDLDAWNQEIEAVREALRGVSPGSKPSLVPDEDNRHLPRTAIFIASNLGQDLLDRGTI